MNGSFTVNIPAADGYECRISEEKVEADGLTTDSTVYTVRVTGKKNPVVTIENGSAKTGEILFKDRYTLPETDPGASNTQLFVPLTQDDDETAGSAGAADKSAQTDTGDAAFPAAWLAGMVIAASALLLILAKRRRRAAAGDAAEEE